MTGKRIWIIEDDRNRCGEASGDSKMLGEQVQMQWYWYHSNQYRYPRVGNQQWPSGTCISLTGTGTPYRKELVANRYWYHTNRYRYRHVIFVGIEQDYDSNARVRSSFDHQLGIIMEKGINAKGKVEKAAFDF